MGKCLAYSRNLIMSVDLSLRKVICGPQEVGERHNKDTGPYYGCGVTEGAWAA